MMIYRKMIATGAHNHLSLNHDIDFTVCIKYGKYEKNITSLTKEN